MIEQYHRPQGVTDEDHNEHEYPEDGRACPTCGRVDAVMKASSVARSNRGRFMLEDGSYAAYESELGSLLSRPARPEPLPISMIVTAFLVGWLLLALDLAIVGVLRAQDEVSIPESALETATYLGLAWFGVLIPGTAIVRYFVRREQVKRRLPAWRAATQRWQAFHYCSRDDLVFVPGEGHGVAPEYLSILYRQTPPSSVVALRQNEAQA